MPNGKRKANVLLKLGQDKLPPRTRSQLVFMDNLRFALETDTQEDRKMSANYAQALQKTTDPDLKPYLEMAKASHDRDIKEAERLHAATLESKVDDNSKLLDQFNMHCHITFSNKFCQFCRSSSHTVENCEADGLGCRLCNEKEHSQFRCPDRCYCTGQIHRIKSKVCLKGPYSGPHLGKRTRKGNPIYNETPVAPASSNPTATPAPGDTTVPPTNGDDKINKELLAAKLKESRKSQPSSPSPTSPKKIGKARKTPLQTKLQQRPNLGNDLANQPILGKSPVTTDFGGSLPGSNLTLKPDNLEGSDPTSQSL